MQVQRRNHSCPNLTLAPHLHVQQLVLAPGTLQDIIREVTRLVIGVQVCGAALVPKIPMSNVTLMIITKIDPSVLA
jgi:hypothetical protein